MYFLGGGEKRRDGWGWGRGGRWKK